VNPGRLRAGREAVLPPPPTALAATTTSGSAPGSLRLGAARLSRPPSGIRRTFLLELPNGANAVATIGLVLCRPWRRVPAGDPDCVIEPCQLLQLTARNGRADCARRFNYLF
jgi:hypothetical protein